MRNNTFHDSPPGISGEKNTRRWKSIFRYGNIFLFPKKFIGNIHIIWCKVPRIPLNAGHPFTGIQTTTLRHKVIRHVQDKEKQTSGFTGREIVSIHTQAQP
jgi:hypothetical protein